MSKVTPIDEEYHFEGSIIISQTDLLGNITFANRKFCEVSGYAVDELVGSSHNIVRHPEMPKAAFEKMWNTISSGHTWNGLVKNIRKDGLYYWVDTEVLPIEDEHHNVIGYIASRKPASRKNIEENEATYEKMYADQG
ncbi:MAG: PAS domain S-box-containing protein [Sulfurimonas sp.]|jgi:PAS domain S-box-containing protein|uniref:PAS domain-containing protein n=1 Tax=Sulfurimonas sp. TaxID=2022749 RepID=UPI0039E27B0E